MRKSSRFVTAKWHHCSWVLARSTLSVRFCEFPELRTESNHKHRKLESSKKAPNSKHWVPHPLGGKRLPQPYNPTKKYQKMAHFRIVLCAVVALAIATVDATTSSASVHGDGRCRCVCPRLSALLGWVHVAAFSFPLQSITVYIVFKMCT